MCFFFLLCLLFLVFLSSLDFSLTPARAVSIFCISLCTQKWGGSLPTPRCHPGTNPQFALTCLGVHLHREANGKPGFPEGFGICLHRKKWEISYG